MLVNIRDEFAYIIFIFLVWVSIAALLDFFSELSDILRGVL